METKSKPPRPKPCPTFIPRPDPMPIPKEKYLRDEMKEWNNLSTTFKALLITALCLMSGTAGFILIASLKGCM